MEERYTLITGGSEGIGLELAKLFAKEGNNLVIVARDVDKLLEAKKELENALELLINNKDQFYSSKKSFSFIFKPSQIYSIISILKYFLCPDKNFDNVALDIPASVLNLETFKFRSAIKLFNLVLIASDKSI